VSVSQSARAAGVGSSRARTDGVFVLLASILTTGLVVAILFSVAVGAVAVPLNTVTRIVLRNLGVLAPGDWTPVQEQIVWQFRMPRVLLAAIVGAALAVSGATLQTVARNTLADPYVFGVSYGASTAAVAVITLGTAAVGGLSLSVAAFIGALLAMLAIYLLAQQGGRVSPTRLVLAGVALSYVLSAITSYLVLRSATPGGGSAAAVLSWLAGSLGGAKWEYLGLPALAVVLCTAWLTLRARPLNALLAGEESAVGLGINTQVFRLELFAITSLLVGVVVAISGAIGFVGLMIPHLARMAVGADHRRVLPIVGLGGAVFLVLADLISRVALAPQELPVGIVTAAIGGPFFLWLLRQRMRGATA
jgi:iron complex transport system permease protein